MRIAHFLSAVILVGGVSGCSGDDRSGNGAGTGGGTGTNGSSGGTSNGGTSSGGTSSGGTSGGDTASGGTSGGPKPPPPEDFPVGFGEPSVFVPNLTNCVRVGAHDGYVYFTEMGLGDGSMSGLSRADGDGNVQSLFSGNTVTALYLDDDELFFVERGTQSVFRMSYSTLEVQPFVTTPMIVADIARLGESMWMSEYGPPATSVVTADRTSAQMTTIEPTISPGFYFTYMAVGATTVYLATNSTNGSRSGIYRVQPDKTGGVFASGVAAAHFTADSDYVYFTSFPDGRVIRQAHDATTAESLAEGQNEPVAVNRDGGGIYWANQGACEDTNATDGSIMAEPLGGGEPVVVASGQTCPVVVATDGDFVYWIRHDTKDGAGTDAIMRAPKLR